MKASEFFNIVQPSIMDIDSAYNRVMGELLEQRHTGQIKGTIVEINTVWMRLHLCADAPENEVDLGGPLWRKVKERFEANGWTVIPDESVIFFGLKDV